MMDSIWIWIIAICYMLSVLVGIGFNWHAVETEFCQENGFFEYEEEGLKEFCLNKQIEGNKMIFEKKEVYCMPRLWLEVFYFQPNYTSCYFVEEVS